MSLLANRCYKRENVGQNKEIRKIAKNQLSHTVDLPPKKQLMVNGSRFYVHEYPMSPALMERIFPSQMNQSYLSKEERTYVRGRDFTIA